MEQAVNIFFDLMALQIKHFNRMRRKEVKQSWIKQLVEILYLNIAFYLLTSIQTTAKGPHQLTREISGSLVAECSTMFSIS